MCALTALLTVSGSQPFLLNIWVHFASLKVIRKELSNGFISQEKEGGRTRLGKILERTGGLGKSKRWDNVRGLRTLLPRPVTILSYMVAIQGSGKWDFQKDIHDISSLYMERFFSEK